MTQRSVHLERRTLETAVTVDLDVRGNRQIEIDTGIGFLDHLFSALAFHAGWNLSLSCAGDLGVDDHHSAEDCALALGEALGSLLGDRSELRRFGSALVPLDESLARAVVDLSGRPWPEIHLGLSRERLGGLSTENVGHVLTSLAMQIRCALHVDLLRGANDHHRAEAAFKATALALRQALEPADLQGVPSTKGALA